MPSKLFHFLRFGWSTTTFSFPLSEVWGSPKRGWGGGGPDLSVQGQTQEFGKRGRGGGGGGQGNFYLLKRSASALT